MLFKSEEKNDDMLDILKHLHKYVPMVESSSTEVVDVDGVEEETTVTHQELHKILLGDQLTVERARGIQDIRENSNNPSHCLEGLVPTCEDWHAKMCLYKVQCIWWVSKLPRQDIRTLSFV